MPTFTNAHSAAISIEYILRRTFSCDRGGFGGMIDADYIEHDWNGAIAAGLAYRYATADKRKQAEIERFLNTYDLYLGMTIQQLLSFQSPTKDIRGVATTIDYESGDDALVDIIKALETVLK